MLPATETKAASYWLFVARASVNVEMKRAQVTVNIRNTPIAWTCCVEKYDVEKGDVVTWKVGFHAETYINTLASDNAFDISAFYGKYK